MVYHISEGGFKEELGRLASKRATWKESWKVDSLLLLRLTGEMKFNVFKLYAMLSMKTIVVATDANSILQPVFGVPPD